MISLYQKILASIFSPFEKLTQSLSDRTTNGIIFLCTLLISSYYIIIFERTPVPFLKDSPTRIQLIGSMVMFVLILFSIKGTLKSVKWSKPLFYLMFFAGLGMLLISFVHKVGSGYRLFSLILLLLFPALYYVWNNREDYNNLYMKFSVSFIVSGFIIYISFLYLSFKGEVELPGGRITPNMNANLFAMFGMITVVSSAYILFLKRRSFNWIVFSTFSFGLGFNIVVLSQSRSCLLVIFGTIVCALVFYIKLIKTNTIKFNPRKIAFILICIAIFAVTFHFIGEGAVKVDTNIQESRIEASDSSNGAQPVEDIDTDVTDRLSLEGKSIESFSSGRVDVWRWYCSHLNLLGNDVFEVSLQEETGRPEVGAHNTILDYGFRFGIPVAVFHLLLEIIVGCMALRVLFSKKFTDPAFLFIALAVMTYAVQSMIELALLPFDRHAVLIYYLAIMPLMSLHAGNASRS